MGFLAPIIAAVAPTLLNGIFGGGGGGGGQQQQSPQYSAATQALLSPAIDAATSNQSKGNLATAEGIRDDVGSRINANTQGELGQYLALLQSMQNPATAPQSAAQINPGSVSAVSAQSMSSPLARYFSSAGGGAPASIGGSVAPPANAGRSYGVTPPSTPPPAATTTSYGAAPPTTGPDGGTLAMTPQGTPQQNQGMSVYTQLKGAPGRDPSYQTSGNGQVYFNGDSDNPSEAVVGPDLQSDYAQWTSKYGNAS